MIDEPRATDYLDVVHMPDSAAGKGHLAKVCRAKPTSPTDAHRKAAEEIMREINAMLDRREAEKASWMRRKYCGSLGRENTACWVDDIAAIIARHCPDRHAEGKAAGLEEAAKLVEGEPFREHYRCWPSIGTGNRRNDTDLAQFGIALATAIRSLATVKP